MTGAQEDWHVVCFAVISTTSNGACSSYVRWKDDVEDDVEMTGGRLRGSISCGRGSRFEKQMRLTYVAQVRASTAQRYSHPQALDQLEEWIKKKTRFLTSLMTSIFRKSSFTIGMGVCQDTLMSTKLTLMSFWGCADSAMVALHLEAG